MDESLTIPCPMPPPGSSIGGHVMTNCVFCGEVNSSTVIRNHRPVRLRDLAARLRRADDYGLLSEQCRNAEAERDALRRLAFLLYRSLSDEPVEDLPWLPPDAKDVLERVVRKLSPHLDPRRLDRE